MTQTLEPGKLGKLRTRKASDDSTMPSICIYGSSGVGKTTLAASAAEVEDMSPILHLNIENGTQSISERYPDVDVLDVLNFKMLQDAYNELSKTRDLELKTCAGYKTIILDNLTEGQKTAAEHYCGTTGTSFTEFEMAQWQDFNKISEMMRRLIRAFRDLPCYVVLVAWEKDMDKGEKTHLWTPSFSKTFAEEAPGLMNDVFRLYFSREGERTLQTARSRDAVAKDRTGKLPATIVTPSMDLLWQYWTGKLVRSDNESPKKGNLKFGKKNETDSQSQT